MSERYEQTSERTSKRANDPVVTSQFLGALNHRGMAGQLCFDGEQRLLLSFKNMVDLSSRALDYIVSVHRSEGNVNVLTLILFSKWNFPYHR